ncbi:MAG: RNA-directed DNA polymerase [Syntrophorhabdales bacterium]|jgi:hypothetical protein
MSRQRFLAFVEDLSPHTIEVDLLSVLLESWGAPDQGLPLINDSLFFMGNAYLSVVDQVVSKHAADFLRFVDDYRIFGTSTKSLEETLTRINGELQQVGFHLNTAKVKLGSCEEYLEAITKIKYAPPEAQSGSDYPSVAIFDDVIEPDQMVKLIERVVSSPDDYLNEGVGRLIIGAIRRMRFNAAVAARKNYPRSPRDEFIEMLSNNTSVIEMAIALLRKYALFNNELWRTAWLLFIMDDMNPNSIKDKDLASRLKETIATLRGESNVPLVARLWANRLWSVDVIERLEPSLIEELHDVDYPEAGRRCYGGSDNA